MALIIPQNNTGLNLQIKTAEVHDIQDIMQVEESWFEESRAPKEKFEARIKKFNQAFFLAQIREGNMLKTVATITAMPLIYDHEHLEYFSNWEAVTNDGFYFDNISNIEPQKNGENALYIVSGVIDKNYRGADVFSPMVTQVVTQAKNIGMEYVLAGAVIPGYKRYSEKYGKIPAYEYCQTRKGHSLVDPLLAMYERIGFHVPDEGHVLPEYFPDDASLNYAALVVCDLKNI